MSRWLLIFLVIGFLLRISLITWGVPTKPDQNWLHPDEHTIEYHLRDFPKSWLENREPQYPVGFGVIAAISNPVYPLVKNLLLKPWDEKKDASRETQLTGWVMFWGRLISMAMALGACVLVYFFTLRFASNFSAFMAMAAVSLSVWHVDHSVFLTGDVPASFAFVLFLFFLDDFLKNPSRKNACLAGGFIGFAVSLKYQAILGVILFVCLGLMKFFSKQLSAKKNGMYLACGGLLAAIVFFGLNVSLFFHPLDTLATLGQESHILASRVLRPWMEWIRLVCLTPWWLMGPLALVIPLGLVGLLRQNLKNAYLVMLPLFFVGMFPGYFPRHTLFFLPVYAVMIGFFFQGAGCLKKSMAIFLLILQLILTGFTVYQRAHDIRQEPEFVQQLRPWIQTGKTLWASPDWAYPNLSSLLAKRVYSISERPDTILIHDEMEEQLRISFENFFDPQTKKMDPRSAYLFFAGVLPFPSEIEVYEEWFRRSPPAYQEVLRLTQPGSRWLQWPLEFFYHEFLIFVRESRDSRTDGFFMEENSKLLSSCIQALVGCGVP